MRTIIALLVSAATSSLVAGVYPDFGYTPPTDWTGPTFVLSQKYPPTQPTKPAFPWEAIDFKAKPADYMQAVIDYCYEGMVAANFKPQNNPARPWFHAPWLHVGRNQREFVNGLTGERISQKFELSANQTTTYRNVAVGFYNELGGYVLGRVWANPSAPNYQNVSFPEGTVSFKLLFTTAPESIAPYLAGSPTWGADLNHSSTAAQVRANQVRLLQVDIAVKDHRSNCGGWVFGTFHYDAAVSASSPWAKLRPLTLVWGNDPGLTETQYNSGTKPQQSWVNPASPLAIYRSNPPAGATPPRVFGWAGRGNGPVDNPVSSCLSCHSTAQIKAKTAIYPPGPTSESDRLRWFRNLNPNQSFDTGQKTLDFSLQLGVGIQNFQGAHPSPHINSVAPTTAAPAQEHAFSRDD